MRKSLNGMGESESLTGLGRLTRRGRWPEGCARQNMVVRGVRCLVQRDVELGAKRVDAGERDTKWGELFGFNAARDAEIANVGRAVRDGANGSGKVDVFFVGGQEAHGRDVENGKRSGR